MGSRKEKSRQKSDRLSTEAGFFFLLVILVHLIVWVSGLSETWWVRMYNQIGMWSWHVSHTHIHPLTAPIFILQTCFTHFHMHPCPSSQCGRASRDPPNSPREFRIKRREKESAREQKQNAFHVFSTSAESRRCLPVMCVGWSFVLTPPQWWVCMSIYYSFFHVFSWFFFFFLKFPCWLRRGRGTTAPEGERGRRRGRERKKEEGGSQTALDMCLSVTGRWLRLFWQGCRQEESTGEEEKVESGRYNL